MLRFHLPTLAATLVVAASVLPARAADPAPLPDTEYTSAGPYRAWLTGPTTRYAHGVLGDAIEAGGFRVQKAGRPFGGVDLPADAVFEDRRARLADVDGDGVPEALVIKSTAGRGAAISVYALEGGVRLLAESAAIGQPNRWLNIVGVANFAGDGRPVIAAVITPHLTGSLRFYRLAGAALVEIGRIDGVTNHIIGERDLDLGRIADVNGDGVPDIVLPTLDRRALATVSFAGGTARMLERRPVAGTIRRLAIAARKATVTLDTGATVALDMTAPR